MGTVHRPCRSIKQFLKLLGGRLYRLPGTLSVGAQRLQFLIFVEYFVPLFPDPFIDLFGPERNLLRSQPATVQCFCHYIAFSVNEIEQFALVGHGHIVADEFHLVVSCGEDDVSESVTEPPLPVL